MRAVVGSDTALWSVLGGFFTPGTSSYSEAGGEVMKRSNMEGAKRLLAESGYANEPVTCLVGQDQPLLKPMGDVTADLLRRLGMNVDFVATDWGTVGQRRAVRNPPGQGGWSMFHTWHAGADCVNPAGYNAVRANGDGALRKGQHVLGAAEHVHHVHLERNVLQRLVAALTQDALVARVDRIHRARVAELG
jgi:peptide/nickel transport system substrate-binding protein